MINRFKKYYNVDNEAVIPPDPESGSCYSFELHALLDTNISFSFTTCSGGGSNITVPAGTFVKICAQTVNPPVQASNKWAIFIGDYCV